MNEIARRKALAAIITADDAAIAAALRDAHVPSLIVALVHLSGDAGFLKPAWQPVFRFGGDGQGELSPAVQAEVRAAALAAIIAYRDRGGTLPPPPGDRTVRAMMDFIAGTPIPEHYVPFLREELALERDQPQPERWDIKVPPETRQAFQVIVIGAGMSGILAGIELSQAGIPFVILEKNADVGGTWLENAYPGCRVDNQNHLYSYSFEPNHDWPQHFSTRDVLYAYFRGVVEKHGLRRHIRFNTAVSAARYDEASGRWSIEAQELGKPPERLAANAVISAVGQLNRPKLPDIAGRDRFKGMAFHSARWPQDLDLGGKRVAVIGTGASAFQIVPAIAAEVQQLTVFQRTPPWLGPAPTYHQDVPEGMKWLLQHVPYYAKWYRFWLFWLLTDGLYPMVKGDPKWQGPARAVSEANDQLRQLLTGHLAAQCGGDKELLEKVVPKYPPGGKRSVRDNGVWIRALKRDNVELITTPIREITERGIMTADGREIAVDVIVHATGFEASRFLMPMQITGRGGRDLHEQWDGDARAYLGMTIPGFPNLFCLYGPNTNIVVNGSIIFFSECSIHYIMGCLKLLLEQGHKSLECRQTVHDAFNLKVDEANACMAWGAPQVNSWYKNAKGRVSQNWPFPLVDYWSATRAPKPGDFIFA